MGSSKKGSAVSVLRPYSIHAQTRNLFHQIHFSYLAKRSLSLLGPAVSSSHLMKSGQNIACYHSPPRKSKYCLPCAY